MLSIKRSLLAGLAITALLATPVWAQEFGAISGTVTDPDGAPLPGVAVTLDSELVPSSTVYTQANGSFRWPALPPGTERYTLTFQLEGFKTVIQENVSVRLGATMTYDAVLELSAIEETVTVTGTSPIVDVKKTGTGQNLTEQYMQSIPSARDPWVMMQQTASMQVNQENIGGSESGQQSGYAGTGSRGGDQIWTYDGAEMTDMSALGASPMYYDFDAFEEIAVTTGGNDPSVATGGVRINFVTKRGGSQWRGSGRLYITDGSWQTYNVGDPETGELVGNYTASELFPGYIGNTINNIKDFGGEFGGPILRDRFFVWGAWGKQDIKQFVAVTPDNTQLKNIHGKGSIHIGDRMVLNYTFLDAAKTKQGRGASATRQGPTTWNQGGDCCIHTGKFQYTLDDNNYVEGSYNFTALGFFLEPQGGREVPVEYDLATGVWGASYWIYDTKRPLKNLRVDANTYIGGADVDHELKYGYSWRQANTRSLYGPSGGAVAAYINGVPAEAWLAADEIDNYGNVRHSFYVGDTISADRLTVNAGLRFDNQDSHSDPSESPPNVFAPDLFPAMSFPGAEVPFSWTGISPRLGLTYRLSDQTILRVNAARYYAQQFNGEFHLTNTTGGAGMDFLWNDTNGNGKLDVGEPYGDPIWISAGFDPANPNAPRDITINETRPPITDELIVGLEHEINRELSVGADFTYKKNDRENWLIRIGEDTAGYWTSGTQTRTLYNGSSQTITVFYPAGPRETSQEYKERPGFNTKYMGVTAYLNKRFANNWMGNASLTLNNGAVVNYDARSAYTDPTNIALADGTAGGLRGSNLSATWFFKTSMMYQLPAGVSLAGFFNIREGYIDTPYIQSNTRPNGVGRVNVITAEPGTVREDTFWNLDLRAEKTFDVSDGVRMHVILDAFNVTGNDIVLNRYNRLTSSLYDRIQEVVQGRTIRIGGRLVLR